MAKKRKHRYENKKHLMWVASLPCLITKAGFHTHSGGVQAHHLLRPYDGVRGMSLRANDRNVIPLCYHHHALLHTKFGSERAFFRSFGLPEDFGQTWAKKYFEYNQDNNCISDLPF
jgi:hypothetical protein|tara:strand:+ start:959 stop:1306 length:348 start_codon:yes stop_codon:yes gene_type:complete